MEGSGTARPIVATARGARLAKIRTLRLSRRAARGERAAFEEIFEAHHQELYRYCLAIVRNREDAEDALQGTMAAALRALPGERREIALRPWLFKVAHNESIAIVRRRRDQTDIDPHELASSDGAGQGGELEARERLRTLVADLGELPERQRSALVMRELSGLSHAEIGTALGCSEGAARQAVYEARVAMRDREEGRAMECDDARRAISANDGRRLRNRRLRSHMKACGGCTAFAASIAERRDDLAALFPALPAAAAASILTGLGGAGAGVSTGAGLTGGGLAGSAAVKAASLIAATALAVGAADMSRLISIPGLGGGSPERASKAAAAPAGADLVRTSPAGDGELGRTAERRGAAPVRDRAGERENTGGRAKGESSADGNGDASGGPVGSAPVTAPTDGGGAAPGASADAPGHTGDAPGGGAADAPGQTGVLPANASTAPGHTGTAGNSASAPGQTGAPPPGQVSNPGNGHAGSKPTG